MKPRIFYLILIYFTKLAKNDIDIRKINLADENESRARIIMIDGNMWIYGGKNGNISLSSSLDGKIFVNDYDVAKTIHFATFTEYETRIVHMKTKYEGIQNKYREYSLDGEELKTKSKEVQDKHHNLVNTYTELQKYKKNKTKVSDNITKNLKSLVEKVKNLENALGTNACEHFQCANGGVCVPKMGDQYLCLCPPQYSGDKCEDDVDECLEANRCQNGGTCVNIKDGFTCACTDGYHGPVCEYKQNTCSETTHLCGPHGACLPTQDSYDCHCHAGFKKSNDPKNPTCIDIDECLGNPCQPGVECINLDGSYQCFGCPLGYKMSHIGCIDVNECEQANSCAPEVKCKNLQGSYECGDCPFGYFGDGRKRCTKRDPCKPFPCGKLTYCAANDHFMNPNGFTCGCEEGEVIDENRENCKQSEHKVCEVNDCLNNSKCRPINETSFECYCDDHHFGDRCEKVSPCQSSNPCQNGKCAYKNEQDVHCQCDPYFYGPYCEFHETLFDEHLTEPTGNFSFKVSENMTNLIKSTYFLAHEPDSLIKITFTKFSGFTQKSINCSENSDFLELYDGQDETYPLFTTFCGRNAPVINQTITLTTTYAFLKFTGSFGEYEGFYQVIPRSCGYRTSKPNGHLVVPQNKQDIICEWFISAPADKLIKITIPRLLLHSGEQKNCEQNKLEIYDGFSVADQVLIRKICSNSKETETYQSTGPFLSVSFISDMLPSAKNISSIAGFSLRYEFVESVNHICGFDIDNKEQVIGLSGYIESPNYGSLYPPNTDCYWNIHGAGQGEFREDLIIKFDFEEFDIPSTTIESGISVGEHKYYPVYRSSPLRHVLWRHVYLCESDYLKFVENDLWQDYCEGNMPKGDTIVTISHVLIKFHSNETVQGRGFRMKYEVLCQQTIYGNRSVETWNFPNGGKAGKCVYTIKPVSSHLIHIKFTSILMETECEDDISNPSNYVEIKGGHEENHPINQIYTCKEYYFMENTSISVHATNELTITVVSDGTEKFKGIAFDVYSFNIDCGGYVRAGEEITTPNYPSDYPPNLKCNYIIESSMLELETFKITFEDFELSEKSSVKDLECKNDRLEIWTSSGSEQKEYIRLCGSVQHAPIILTADRIDLFFYSGFYGAKGIKAKVEAISSSKPICDQSFHDSVGEIIFPPKEHPFTTCTYHISVANGQRIVLTMNEMNMPCHTSHLEFFDGIQNNSSASFQKICGTQNTKVIRTTANKATIIFKTTNPSQVSFKVSYEVQVGCGKRTESISGFIASPQYPYKENREVNCEWRITAAHGNRISFEILFIDNLNRDGMYATSKCPHHDNYLEITEPNGQNKILHGTYCREIHTSELVTSKANEILVKYTQYKVLRKKISGFAGRFFTICKDIELTDFSGIIQSPGYPDITSSEQICDWRITVPMGNRIVVTFTEFIVDRNSLDNQECSNLDNHFKVEDMFLSGSTVITKNGTEDSQCHKFCDLFIPTEIRSRHNRIEMKYETKDQPNNRFMLSYYTVGCVGDISYPQDIIVNRADIDTEYHDNFECQYTITAPVGQRIKLAIDSFDVQHNERCQDKSDELFKGMKVFVGSSNSSGHAKYTICAVQSRSEYEMHTNQIFVQVKLGNNFKHSQNVFLKASVIFHEKKDSDHDGQIIDLSEQKHYTITSPNYPSTYPRFTRNEWIFKAAIGHHIEFSLLSFWPESQNSGDGDPEIECSGTVFSNGVIRINEGNATNSLKKYVICNMTDTKLIINSDVANVLFMGAIEELSDKKKKFGFALKAEQVCGGVFLAGSEEKTMYLDLKGKQSCSIELKSQEEGSGVYATIDSFRHIVNDTQTNEYDSGGLYFQCDDTKEGIFPTKTTYQLDFHGKNRIFFKYLRLKSDSLAVIRYGPSQLGCGPTKPQKDFKDFDVSFATSIDCIWNLENTLGNRVSLEVKSHNFPGIESCSKSFIEVRDSNEVGELLFRGCGSKMKTLEAIKATSLYIHLKHLKDDSSDDIRRGVSLRMKKLPGGHTSSKTLLPPASDSDQHFTWNIGVDKILHIRFSISQVALSKHSFITFSQRNDLDEENNQITKKLTGFPPNGKFILPFSEVDIQVSMHPGDDFKIQWEPITTWAYDNEIDFELFTSPSEDTPTRCGEQLTPTWEWQSITNPLPENQTSGYDKYIHCIWPMNKKQFNGIEMKFEALDLSAKYCFRAYVEFSKNGVVDYQTRHCDLSESGHVFAFNDNENIDIHFKTFDNSTSGGFKLLYRLKCGSTSKTPLPDSFEYTLTNPPFPTDSDNIDCEWNFKSSHNRKISVEVMNLNMTYCDGDNALLITHTEEDKTKFCEKMTNETQRIVISKADWLSVRYQSTTSDNIGFEIKVREVLVECPGEILRIDEDHPSRVIHSPEYPKSIPHSSECQYVIGAPNGHRIMLSFDPDNFDMEEPIESEYSDYLEVRDGSSEKSQLLRIITGTFPPSTIVSKANFIFMKLHTDEKGSSNRFIAKFELARCGGTLVLEEENREYTITSPDYPKPSSSLVSCNWTVRSRNTHMILFRIDHIWDNRPSQHCDKNKFSIIERNSTIYTRNNCDSSPTDLETFTRSSSSEITVTFVNNVLNTVFDLSECARYRDCGFKLVLKLSEEKCGGDITDDHGVITLPGYPNTLLPNVKCDWDFKADPGFIWSLNFRFIDKENYNSFDQCYEDLKVFNSSTIGKIKPEFFCKNYTEKRSVMDTVHLAYDDSHSRDLMASGNPTDFLFSPFEISYAKIPAKSSDIACTYSVTEKSTWRFDFNNETSSVPFNELCHLSIEKPEDYQSTHIKIVNFKSVKNVGWCQQDHPHILLKTELYDHEICGSAFTHRKEEDMVFTDEKIDLFIVNQYGAGMGLEFEVDFKECGGHVTEPMYAHINSSKIGPCKWLLEAPTGQVVQIKIIEMNCNYGKLAIGEGREFKMNILYTYCEKGEPEEHFKTITSKSRFMTIVWNPESEHEKAWWLEYEFVNEQDTCGNTQTGKSGIVHTRSYGSEYLPDQRCIWYLQAPTGYHIGIEFKYFDIETSERCSKDGLYFSEFLSTEDEIGKKENPPICGHEIPEMYHSARNNLKITFKTDEDTNGKGFNLEWKAVCGQTFDSSEGVITSPNYPESSFNIGICDYIVNAKPDDLFELDFQDFDFDDSEYRIPIRYGNHGYPRYGSITSFNSHVQYSTPSGPCPKHYIQIIPDNNHNFDSGKKRCNRAGITNNELLIKGPFKIRARTESRNIRYHRGFKIAYRKIECGGNINLTENTKLWEEIKRPRVGYHAMECVWNFTTSPNRELIVTFENLNTALDCERDYVQFFTTDEFEMSFGKYCGSSKQMPTSDLRFLISNLAVKMVYTYTNDSFLGSIGGVKLIVSSTLGFDSGCGGHIWAGDEWESLTPPKTADIGYSANINCRWTIMAPRDHQIILQLNSIDMDKTENCPFDQLSIIDGHDDSKRPFVRNVCKVDILPLKKITTGSDATIIFKSKKGGNGGGFNITYSIEKIKCGGNIIMQEGIGEEKIESPKQENHTEQICEYIFRSYWEKPILVRFTKFQIPKLNCEHNYMEVHNWYRPWRCESNECFEMQQHLKSMKFCGGDHIPHLISYERILRITLRYETGKEYTFIKFDYQSLDNCNRTIDITDFQSGRLTSPNYPLAQDAPIFCTTRLENSSFTIDTKKLLIVFRNVMLDGYNDTKFIEISEDAEGKPLREVGFGSSDLVLTDGGSTVNIVMNAEKLNKGAGYDATYYSVIREEANITEFAENHDLHGVLSNHEFPNTNVTRLFTIRPAKSHKCDFTITWNEVQRPCISKGPVLLIENIVNGQTATNNSYTSCEKGSNTIILDKSEGERYLKISFISNSNNHTRFDIQWDCDDSIGNY